MPASAATSGAGRLVASRHDVEYADPGAIFASGQAFTETSASVAGDNATKSKSTTSTYTLGNVSDGAVALFIEFIAGAFASTTIDFGGPLRTASYDSTSFLTGAYEGGGAGPFASTNGTCTCLDADVSSPMFSCESAEAYASGSDGVPSSFMLDARTTLTFTTNAAALATLRTEPVVAAALPHLVRRSRDG